MYSYTMQWRQYVTHVEYDVLVCNKMTSVCYECGIRWSSIQCNDVSMLPMWCTMFSNTMQWRQYGNHVVYDVLVYNVMTSLCYPCGVRCSCIQCTDVSMLPMRCTMFSSTMQWRQYVTHVVYDVLVYNVMMSVCYPCGVRCSCIQCNDVSMFYPCGVRCSRIQCNDVSMLPMWITMFSYTI